jgi:hypothetical protein
MTTDCDQYVIIQASDCYFGFDLLDKVERACIFALIHSNATHDVNGWMVSKILPQWVGGYSDWLMYEKQVANVSSDNHNKFGQINDSITYSGGFNSDEDKGSSKADSSKSDTREECFMFNDHVKNHEKQHVASQSGKPKKTNLFQF